MPSPHFTLLELTDLSLGGPEIGGAINFNILRTVVTKIIYELRLEDLKLECHIEDDVLAQETITKIRMKQKADRKLPSKVLTTQEIKDKLQKTVGKSDPAGETQKKDMTIADNQKTTIDLMENVEDILDDQTARLTEQLQKTSDEKLLEDILQGEHERVLGEIWHATNLKHRMDAAEETLQEMATIIDGIMRQVAKTEQRCDGILKKTRSLIEDISSFPERIQGLEEKVKLNSLRILENSEMAANEIQRLEDLIKRLMRDLEETKSALELSQKRLEELSQQVVYQEDLEEAKSQMLDSLELKMKEMRKLLRQVEDGLVKKVHFTELVNRVDALDELKVNRDELGRLLEPGFIDTLLSNQESLRTELDDLKTIVSDLGKDLEALKTRIDEEILKMIESNFASVNAVLDSINAKLALLDPEEINGALDNLEDQVAMIIKEFNEMKDSFEQLQKDAKIHFSKISNVNELIKQLELTKADKTKMYELLEQKADLDMLMDKLDRTEFVSVVGDMKKEVERLTIRVQIQEEELNERYKETKQELALKMYMEDFIACTEPIRNRIKALMYELKRVKDIAKQQLFADAPGVVKCMSCNRGAHLAGPRFMGDAYVELPQEVAAQSTTRQTSNKSSIYQSGGTSQDTSNDKSQTVDLDSITFPPADKPREKNLLHLEYMLAAAKPNVGLAHEKRKAQIDKELAAFFTTKPNRPCEGKHTRTSPHQRGAVFTPQPIVGKEIELEKGVMKSDSSRKESEMKKGVEKSDSKQQVEKVESREAVTPAIVRLHVNDKPV